MLLDEAHAQFDPLGAMSCRFGQPLGNGLEELVTRGLGMADRRGVVAQMISKVRASGLQPFPEPLLRQRRQTDPTVQTFAGPLVLFEFHLEDVQQRHERAGLEARGCLGEKLGRLLVPVQEHEQMAGIFHRLGIGRIACQDLPHDGQGLFIAIFVLQQAGPTEVRVGALRRQADGLVDHRLAKGEVAQRPCEQAAEGMPARSEFGGRSRVRPAGLARPAPCPVRPAAAEDAEGVVKLGFPVRRIGAAMRGAPASWTTWARPTGTPGVRPARSRRCRSTCAAALLPAKPDRLADRDLARPGRGPWQRSRPGCDRSSFRFRLPFRMSCSIRAAVPRTPARGDWTPSGQGKFGLPNGAEAPSAANTGLCRLVYQMGCHHDNMGGDAGGRRRQGCTKDPRSV